MDHFAWEKPFFKNREEAAQLLAGRLVDYKGENPLVLAIPHGAVPIGRIIADELKGELDVVLVHKVGAPGNLELALGAVNESGEYYEGHYARSMGYPEEKIQTEIQRQVKALKEKRKLYGLGAKSRVDKRIVILVDDGIATASTMMAAIREVRRKGPLKVVVVAAVAPPEAMDPSTRKPMRWPSSGLNPTSAR